MPTFPKTPLTGIAQDFGRKIEDLAKNALSKGKPYQTATVSTKAISLHAVVGSRRGAIGGVHSISTTQGRPVEDIFEVNADGVGLPVHLVPGNLTERTFRLDRYDLYTGNMEKIFGSPTAFLTLVEQRVPISLRLRIQPPAQQSIFNPIAELNPNLTASAASVYEFYGCYFTSLGRTISVDDAVVGASGTLVWSGVRQIQ